ncbi:MAG: autotransporter outer membrane beta-barrel domain-containing protein [Desulfobacterales bacterium]|nr:autotransporter outer membrane beta-barrel domain-containing protein [Desulfobacterales bacterium]
MKTNIAKNGKGLMGAAPRKMLDNALQNKTRPLPTWLCPGVFFLLLLIAASVSMAADVQQDRVNVTLKFQQEAYTVPEEHGDLNFLVTAEIVGGAHWARYMIWVENAASDIPNDYTLTVDDHPIICKPTPDEGDNTWDCGYIPVTMSIHDDGESEIDESFTITVQTKDVYQIILNELVLYTDRPTASCVVTIIDNDRPEMTVTTDPDPLTLTGIPGQSVDGGLDISGGVGPYTLQVPNGSGVVDENGAATFTYNIPVDAQPGEHGLVITVTDDAGGRHEVDATIVVPTPPEIILVSSDYSKKPGETATGVYAISVEATPYAVDVANGSIQMDSADQATFTYAIPADAPPGEITETITVTDAMGQQASVNAVITVLCSLEVVLISSDYSKPPGETASGVYDVSGGTSPYDVQVSSGAAEVDAAGRLTYEYTSSSDATPGVYRQTITVTDQGGCVVETDVHIIVVPFPLGVTPGALEMTGRPGETVGVDFNISGGQPAYTIDDPPGLGSVDEAGLDTDGPASYSYTIPLDALTEDLSETLTVTDAVGNMAETPVTIHVDSDMKIPGEPIQLAGSPGETVSDVFDVRGGNPPYTLVVSTGSGEIDPREMAGPGVATYTYTIPAGAPGGWITETITVTDQDGDRGVVTVNIEVTPKLTISPEDPTLPGIPGNYAMGVLSVSGGKPGYTIAFEAPGSKARVEPSALSGPGSFTYYYRIESDEEDGTHHDTVTVTDAAGKTTTSSITIRVSRNPLSTLPGLSESDIPLARNMEEIYLDIERSPRELTAGEQDLIIITNGLINAAMGDANRGASQQAEVVSALEMINPDNVTATFDISFLTAVQQARNIKGRLLALRNGASGFSTRGLALKLDGRTAPADLLDALMTGGQPGGAAGADNPSDGRFGVFIGGEINIGDKDDTDAEPGFDFDSAGLTAGIDYRFTRDLVLGAALGFASTGVDFFDHGDELEMEGWSASIYGTFWVTDALYVDGVAMGEWNDFDSRRNIDFTLPGLDIDRTAKADYDGAGYSLDVGAGYELNFDAFTLDLFGRLMYSRFKSDGFEETGADGLDMAIDDLDATFLTSTLGARASYALSTSIGVISPNLLFEWKHEFEDQGDAIPARFVNDLEPSRWFEIPTDKQDSNYFRWGLGASMVFPRGVSAYINYHNTSGLSDITNHNISLGGRFEF